MKLGVLERFTTNIAGITAVLFVLVGNPVARAASHSDAPLIKQDPQANLTDVYSFIGWNSSSQKVLNVIVHVRPFSEPGDGVMYERFADDALYSIHIANPTTGQQLVRYDFQFSSVANNNKSLNTILSYGLGGVPITDVGDAGQNFTQFYTVTRQVGKSNKRLGSNLTLMVAPPNVGLRTTPFYDDLNGVAISGATSTGTLDRYTSQTIYTLPAGEKVFCGPREDGFYADTAGIFDLLHSRILDNDNDFSDGLGQDGNGIDGFKGFNVLAYAIQIPVSLLAAANLPGFPTVGVYASVSRRNREFNNGVANAHGPWHQVNRMGNPLFNEVLVPLAGKDHYNRLPPTVDIALFRTFAANSELAALINLVYSTSFVTSNRDDLVNIFIPDVLRVNTSTEAVRLAGQPGFQRFSFIAGDTTTNGTPSGWPNGRRLGDDVVDIALTAIASGPAYTNIVLVGDNVAANDALYNLVFPYSGTPHAGSANQKDSP